MQRLPIVLLMVGVLLALANPRGAAPASAAPATQVDLTAPAMPGQFVIKFKEGTDNQTRGATVHAHGGRMFDRIAGLDIDAVEFPALQAAPNAHATEALVKALQHNPNVEYVEPNYIYTGDFVPNDPDRTKQYAWTTIHAYDAWDVTGGSSTTRVAIVDTGIWAAHPDLAGKVLAGYDFVDNDTTPNDGHGHGTHVAGTAAARTHNTVGGAGMCINCRLIPVRVLGNDGRGTLVNVAKGINYAANRGARVINLSLGGSGSSTLQSAVNYAWSKGAFLACAAGNNNSSSLSYPAAYANCFAVASTTSTDARSSFSNYGSWVEAAAPGSSIYSTVPTGSCSLCAPSGYRYLNGTSMATPHVAGLAGLLVGQGLTNAQIRDTICYSSEPISGTGTFWQCGRINAVRAVMAYATPVPADYDGDHRADLGIKTPEGRWLLDFATNGFGKWNRVFSAYGGKDAHPVPADYDGDGKADPSVKSDAGDWFIDYASDGFGAWNQILSGYGDARALPMPADYDGDGKADLSVKSDAGDWFIDYASDGFGAWNQMLSGYGAGDAHPVPADYDGDGKADLSVKSDAGDWFIDYASDGFGAWNQMLSGYGGTEGHPVPVDYDGDGKADLALKTYTDGRWLIDFAADGFGSWNRIIY